MRKGGAETCGTVEDCLKHAEMIVFWAADPEATSGVYGAHEGTTRRQWLKDLGIPMVHIDPYYNHTAAWLGGKWLGRAGRTARWFTHRIRLDHRRPVRQGIHCGTHDRFR